jgi:hypothetical protein
MPHPNHDLFHHVPSHLSAETEIHDEELESGLRSDTPDERSKNRK